MPPRPRPKPRRVGREEDNGRNPLDLYIPGKTQRVLKWQVDAPIRGNGGPAMEKRPIADSEVIELSDDEDDSSENLFALPPVPVPIPARQPSPAQPETQGRTISPPPARSSALKKQAKRDFLTRHPPRKPSPPPSPEPNQEIDRELSPELKAIEVESQRRVRERTSEVAGRAEGEGKAREVVLNVWFWSQNDEVVKLKKFRLLSTTAICTIIPDLVAHSAIAEEDMRFTNSANHPFHTHASIRCLASHNTSPFSFHSTGPSDEELELHVWHKTTLEAMKAAKGRARFHASPEVASVDDRNSETRAGSTSTGLTASCDIAVPSHLAQSGIAATPEPQREDAGCAPRSGWGWTTYYADEEDELEDSSPDHSARSASNYHTPSPPRQGCTPPARAPSLTRPPDDDDEKMYAPMPAFPIRPCTPVMHASPSAPDSAVSPIVGLSPDTGSSRNRFGWPVFVEPANGTPPVRPFATPVSAMREVSAPAFVKAEPVEEEDYPMSDSPVDGTPPSPFSPSTQKLHVTLLSPGVTRTIDLCHLTTSTLGKDVIEQVVQLTRPDMSGGWVLYRWERTETEEGTEMKKEPESETKEATETEGLWKELSPEEGLGGQGVHDGDVLNIVRVM